MKGAQREHWELVAVVVVVLHENKTQKQELSKVLWAPCKAPNSYW